MSTRTFKTIGSMPQNYRETPKQIISKLNSNINQIQAEVAQFNLRQQRAYQLASKSIHGKYSTLKMLTQPKLQNILLEKDFNFNKQFMNFDQLGFEQLHQKKSRLNRQNTLNNNNFFVKRKGSLNKNQFSKVKRSPTYNVDNQKGKKYNNLTYVQTPQENVQIQKLKANYSAKMKINKSKNNKCNSFCGSVFDSKSFTNSILLKDRNRVSTFNNSITMPFADQINLNQEQSCQLQASKNIQFKITLKQKQLEKEWEKTQKYKNKLGLENFNQKHMQITDRRFRKNSKVNQIIDKIKDRRPYTTMTNRNSIDSLGKVGNQSIIIELS